MPHDKAWGEVEALKTDGFCLTGQDKSKEQALNILADMLLDLNKAIWDHDAPVRMMEVDFSNDAMLAKIGLLACDARDFNEFRTRTVDLINLLCGDERERPTGMNQNRFAKG